MNTATQVQRWFAAGLCVFFSLAASAGRCAASDSTPGNGEYAHRVRERILPRLTVLISIDQFRADYVRRLDDLMLPARSSDGSVGGFRYLMTAGSYFTDARYDYAPTVTGCGHAALLTGGCPDETGIVSNDWWDPATQSTVYCVNDPRQTVVGASPGSKAKPMGPLHLLSTTVGDELKLATAGHARVVTLSLKDRAAILLGGHAQDLSIWFDDFDGRWISSTAFCHDGKLPDWVEQVNGQHIPDKTLGTTWTPGEPAAVLDARAMSPKLTPEHIPYHMGAAFPHPIAAGNYRAFTLTPAASAYVLQTAEAAVKAEQLGQRDTPDLLAINLATNDYVGHAFGPYSPEALDVTVQTDRELGQFFTYLDKTVPGGLKNVVIVVTADHGVCPVPENLEDMDVTTGRVLYSAVTDAAQKALSDAFGGGNWLAAHGAFVEPYVNLDPAMVSQAIASGKAPDRARIEQVAADAVASIPGIYACYTHAQIMEGRLPVTDITRRVIHGFYPKVSGDIYVVPEALRLFDYGPGPAVTSHSTPYAYDTHVPILIAGPGIRPGVWADPVTPTDIAPTLCQLLGIEYPSGCEGVVLTKALD